MKRAALAAALLACATVLAEDKKPPPPRKIEGFVVDAGNVLQPEAELALQWNWSGGAATAVDGIKADAKGHFERTFKKWPGGLLVLAYNDKRDKGCLMAVNDEASKKPLTVRLGPLVKVKGKLATTDPLVPLPADVTLTIATVEGNADVVKVKSGAAGFSLRIPPGKYRLRWGHELFRAIEQEFDAGPRAELDLGLLSAQPTPVATGLGKTMPPFNAAFVRGGKPDLQITDYKGKWVLVLFWGSWCPTSSTQWLPTLIEFHERLRKTYDNYQILAYHDATAKSFEEMEEKLAKHGDIHWNPRDIPFPLLLDAQEGGTVKTWGVTGEPTVFLFDPEGRLVKHARDYGMLEKELMGGGK
ncbi:MAG: TlpA family protein disulfide reductase [Planctomycetes bacterium]|nr:TlpA family protein disulfide reductase [Planctomycetota bacterium]